MLPASPAAPQTTSGGAPLDAPERLRAVQRTALEAGSDPAFDRFARMVTRQLGVPVGLVSLVDDRRQIFPGQVGLPAPWCDLRETPLSHSFCQHVVTSGEPLVIEDARNEPGLADNLAITDLQVVAYAGMPLTDGSGNVLGSLCAISDQPRVWSDADLSFLADLAATCSSELHLRIAARSARAAASRLALLAEVGSAVVTTLDAEEAISRLVRLVVPTLGDWAIASIVDPGPEVRATVSRHRDTGGQDGVARVASRQAAQLGDLPRTTPASTVLATGEPVVLSGEETAALVGEDLPAGRGLVVPLRARGGALGYLTLGRTSEGYSEDDLRDAVDLGRRAGLALDNAELYRKQSENALLLQNDLLTRMPEPDHLHLHPKYVPATDSAQIGGDWYDAFLQPDGATVLVVGDVMGHDMRAAATMGALRNLVRGIAYDRQDSPAELLTRIDRALRGLEVEVLATVLVARIEQTDADKALGMRRLRWSSAGHPPPFLLLADGTVSQLDGEGELLLGIDPDTGRSDQEVPLPPDSTLVLYTDGLVERRDSPLEHGLARMRQALAGLADVPLPELCDTLLSRLLPHGSEDDVAMLAVRAFDERRPRPAEAGPEFIPGED